MSDSVTTTSPATGYNTIAMTSIINWPGLPIDSDGNPYFYLASGDTIQCTFATTITSGKAVNIHVVTADF
jgi:hypothetical protein